MPRWLRTRDSALGLVDPLTEGEWPRIVRDFWKAIGSPKCSLFIAGLGVVAAAIAAFIAQDDSLDPLATAEWGVGMGIGWPAAFCLVVLVLLWPRTLKAQRDEARRELVRRTPATLAVEFSEWVRAKRGELPVSPWRRRLLGLFRRRPEERARARAERQMDPEARRREIENVEAQARTEYNERFRDSVLALLEGSDEANAPGTIRDFEALAEFVQAASLAGVSSAWINRQLTRGNELLHLWPRTSSRENDEDMSIAVQRWERDTHTGLARYAPADQAQFRVDVGLGPEWREEYHSEPPERAMLRRRIHRLAEIAKRDTRGNKGR